MLTDPPPMIRIAAAMTEAATDRSFASLYRAFAVVIGIIEDMWIDNENRFYNHKHCPKCGYIIRCWPWPPEFPETNRCSCGWVYLLHRGGRIEDDAQRSANPQPHT